MKLKFLSLFIIFTAIIICGCSLDETQATSNNSTAEEIQKNIDLVKEHSGVSSEVVKVDKAEEILNSMTLEEKIGQMLIVGFYGNSLNDDIKFLLNSYHFGGIIFFDRNLETKEQVKKMTADLNFAAAQKLPIFFAIDEEGGKVARMKEILTPPPSQEEIGNSGDSSLAYSYAKNIAQELKNMGINLNFAPVADVGTRDTRSFSDKGEIVAEFVSQAAKGYEDAGIFYCLKHFPGIGLQQLDSHNDISTIDADRNTFDTIDLLPFKKIISENDNSKFMVMVSHFKYTAFDAENSATLSPAIMTQLLRNELKFSGVIITDDLNMGAVSKYHDAESLAVQAVKAGADIVLICHEYEKQKEMYEGIFAAVKRGEISEQRINDSVHRILKMKLELNK